MRLANIEGEPVFDEPRPGDIKHSCANIEKARKILGFEPQTTLEEGIKKLLDTYNKVKNLTPSCDTQESLNSHR
jgi:nucleoside-diphosphate-sugar epimerase